MHRSIFIIKPDLPIYILIGSLFTSGFVIQYLAIACLLTYLFLNGKLFKIPKNTYTKIISGIVGIAVVSWLWNLIFALPRAATARKFLAPISAPNPFRPLK